jgi:hypothetical protein
MVTALLVCGIAPIATACDQSSCAEDCPNIQCDQASFRPDTGLGNPSLAIGLNGISDWSTQHPFFDLMKTARPWIGHLPGQWGGIENSEIEASGILDKDGWPMSLPARAETIEALILTEQPPAFEWLNTRYLLTYEGSGQITVTGRAANIRHRPGKIWFDYSPGEGSVGIAIRSTDPRDSGDYIRNIRVMRSDHVPLAELGAIFNPHWLNVISDFRVLRFMDWMNTNGSMQRVWSNRGGPSFSTSSQPC